MLFVTIMLTIFAFLFGCQRSLDVERYAIPNESYIEATYQYYQSKTQGFSWPELQGWVLETPSSSLVKLALRHSESDALLTVSSFAGEVGLLLNNINRWRKQLGLNPVTSDQSFVSYKTYGHHSYQIISLESPTQFMSVGMLKTASKTWVVKMVANRSEKPDLRRYFERFLIDFEVSHD